MSNGLMSAIDAVAAAAEQNCPRDNEIMGEDGLLYCQVCGGARQVIVQPFPELPAKKVRCVCKCTKIKEAQQKLRERQEEADRRRSVCFQGTNMASWNFANDDRKRPQLSDGLQKYAEQFPEHRKKDQGLLLYGNVGTGKTYLAACVANAVIDQGYRVFMTNFANVANALQSTWEKDAYIRDLCKYDLLILDDLGAERKNSEYMQEIVFNVIDARYRAGGPVIITTNLTPEELTQTKDMGYSRIYDRVLERCLAIKVDGPSRRRQAAAKSWDEIRKQLGMEAKA